MQDSEPACKTLGEVTRGRTCEVTKNAEEVELALRELNHLERTIVEKQI